MRTGDPSVDLPLGRVDIPIKEILREAQRPAGQRLASAAKVAYRLRQAAQRARAAVEARRREAILRWARVLLPLFYRNCLCICLSTRQHQC